MPGGSEAAEGGVDAEMQSSVMTTTEEDRRPLSHHKEEVTTNTDDIHTTSRSWRGRRRGRRWEMA